MDVETLPGRPAGRYVIHGLAGLRERAGSALGTSRWIAIDQDMITRFAELSGDRQWIHVDPERAEQGPFGVTIAHGFFTLSLSTDLLEDIFSVDGVTMILNYGLNRVRFPAPLPVGSRICMHAALTEATDIGGGIQVVYHLEFEIEGRPKPCCVADLVFRYYALRADQGSRWAEGRCSCRRVRTDPAHLRPFGEQGESGHANHTRQEQSGQKG